MAIDNKEYQKEYREKNKEKYIEYQRAYREKNRERLRELHLNRYYKNKDNIEHKEYTKKYYQENKDAYAKRQREYRATEHGAMVKVTLENKRRASKMRSSDGTIPQYVSYPLTQELQDLLDRQEHKCNDCDTHISRELGNIQLDHHIPLSKGGTHSIDNVVWLCASCNINKRDKMPDRLLLV